MYKFAKRTLKTIALAALGFSAATMTSCDDNLIYDNRDDCHSAIDLRFVFDYHMEPGANAFPTNVDCVTVFVLDTDGNYITRFEETTEQLRDEHYKMHLPLDEGHYQLLVYGGVTCEKPTFNFHPFWEDDTRAGHKSAIRVSLPLDENGESASKLHDIEERTGGLFYGTLDLVIDNKDWTTNHRTETVYLMKDTNTIQVMLQELAYPNQIDYNDYEFKIIDDNFVLDGDNKKITSVKEDGSQPIYRPYYFENRIMGYVDPDTKQDYPAYEDPDNMVQIACAEFGTSRLFVEHMPTARLVISSKTYKNPDGTNKVLIDIPFITYLAATRGLGQNWIKSDQEYLDRQSNWTMMFFLQKNVWVSAKVVVNSWVVRVNNIEL